MLSTIALTVLMGSAPAPQAATAIEGTLRLVGRFAVAHACAVDSRLALTSAHVVDPRPFEDKKPVPYAWSDEQGAEGWVEAGKVDRARDLATLHPVRPDERFPHPLPIAAAPPKPGDRI